MTVLIRIRTATLIAALAMSAVAACNTIEGAGKDIQKGGEKLEEAAKDIKKKL